MKDQRPQTQNSLGVIRQSQNARQLLQSSFGTRGPQNSPQVVTNVKNTAQNYESIMLLYTTQSLHNKIQINIIIIGQGTCIGKDLKDHKRPLNIHFLIKWSLLVT
jgi:hypothetical protein